MHLPSWIQKRPVTEPVALRLVAPPRIVTLTEQHEQLTFVELEDQYGVRRTCLELPSAMRSNSVMRHLAEQLVKQSAHQRDRFTPARLQYPNAKHLLEHQIIWSIETLTASRPRYPGAMIHCPANTTIVERSPLRLQYTYLIGGAFCRFPRSLVTQTPITVHCT